MRVTGGSASNRILKVPKGLDVRPTPDLVKQAIFNSLGERVLDRDVLELFAGSGALSLESLSRGAKQAICIEKSARHGQLIKQNAAAVGLPPGALQVRVEDAFTAIRQLAGEGRQFDLILADPPYGEKNIGRRSTSFAQKLLDDPQLPALLRPGSIFILGHTKRDTLTFPDHLEETKMLKHGDTVIRFLKLKQTETK
jgi:16S rRNA (guanine966-N2)-methyltransferase